MAVIIPTGISKSVRLLAIVSADIMNAAPPAMLNGTRLLWSGPTIILTRCGTISPTQPIIPLTDTAIPTARDDAPIKTILSLFTFTPNALASSSPILNALSLHLIKNTGRSPAIIPGPAIFTMRQSAKEKLPINQKTMLWSLWGSTRNFTIETRAVKKAEMITPDSISGSLEISPWVLAMAYARRTAAIPKINAMNCIGRLGKNPIDRAHPNAAPADMPRMNGSTSGLRNIPCSVTPEPERATPTSPARITLGSLMSIIIAFSGISGLLKKGQISEAMIFRTNKGVTLYAPIKRAIQPTKRGEEPIINIKTINLLFKGSHLAVGYAEYFPVEAIRNLFAIHIREKFRIGLRSHPQGYGSKPWRPC